MPYLQVFKDVLPSRTHSYAEDDRPLTYLRDEDLLSQDIHI